MRLDASSSREFELKMQLEFREFVRQALCKLGHADAAIEVETCPTQYDAQLTSPVLFSLTRDPQSLAQRFLETVSAADFPGRGLFLIEIGGAGHLNAQPTESFYRQFFLKLLESGPEILLNTATFVLPTTGEEILLNQNWERVCAALKSAAPEDAALLSKNDPEFSKAQTRLMALGVLADDEISVEPFVLGLCSRENLPWLFQRFGDDMSASLKKSEDFLPELISELIAEPRLAALREGVLAFRGELLKASRLKRPEIFLAQLLGLLKSVYAQYNCPEFRAFIATPPGACGRLMLTWQRQLLGLGLSRIFIDQDLHAIRRATGSRRLPRDQ